MEELEFSTSDVETSPGTKGRRPARGSSEKKKTPAAALAITSLILGLVGLYAWAQPSPICGLPASIIGLALGLAARHSVGRKVAIAGLILCSAGLALGIATGSLRRHLGLIGAPCPPQPLQVPSTYVPGMDDIPDGQYLFVEWWASHDRSPPRECGGYYDEPTYAGGREHLSGYLWQSSPSGIPVKGFSGAGHSSSGGGFCGAFSTLSTITTFPFVVPDVSGPPIFVVPGADVSEGDIVIQSADANGAIVAEVKGCAVWIEPGQSWKYQVNSFGLSGTQSTVYRLTNYGLLDGNQVNVRGFRPGVTEQ
jgi:hypothetical protein